VNFGRSVFVFNNKYYKSYWRCEMKTLISIALIGFIALITGIAYGALNDGILSQHVKEADGTSGQDTNAGSGIKTGHIQNGAITANKMKQGAVKSGKIADGAVTNTKIATGAITPDKIGFYSNVAIVAPTGGDYTDPVTAMTDVSSWCGIPSPTNPCLLKIMPGVYDIGTNAVVTSNYVDIEGSGENITKIRGNIDNIGAGVLVSIGDNIEIRSLTVENTGGGTHAIAIKNNDSLKMTSVTAIASGGTNNCGVYNYNHASPIMVNVTAIGSGGSDRNYGVKNFRSSPTMINVKATGSGGPAGGTNSYGVYNEEFSSPTMSNVTAYAFGGTYNFGVYSDSLSSPVMTDVKAVGSGGSYSFGISGGGDSTTVKLTNVTAIGETGNYNCGIQISGDTTMTDIIATASGGNENYGIRTNGYTKMSNIIATGLGGERSDGIVITGGHPVMSNVIATGSGGTYSNGVSNAGHPIMTNVTATGSLGTRNCGVYNSGSPMMTNVTATGSDGAENYGVYNEYYCTVRIDHSVITGSTNTIRNQPDATAYVGSTRLDGGAVSNSGTITCAAVYDENYAFYPNTCP
jgi:hypothetical protein